MDHAEEINPPAPAGSSNVDAKRILNERGFGADEGFRATERGWCGGMNFEDDSFSLFGARSPVLQG